MDRVYFKINGKSYSAGGEFPADTSLNTFIRSHADLRGTKYMCKEGGCGACVVNVRVAQPSTHEISSFSVNSCLVLIMSCDTWDITTVEGIGNRKTGYHIIQKRLNHYFGSQCGFCSPGFVMSMYSLAQSSDHHLTQKEIEESLGSNLCRCTGYRPILEAFKSLAVDADSKVLSKIKDIEDVGEHVCNKSNKKCGSTCHEDSNRDWCLVNMQLDRSTSNLPKKIELADGRIYYKANNVNAIFKALDQYETDSYMLIGGNTAKGVRPIISYPKLLIEVSNIKELTNHYLDQNLVLGANMTLTDTLKVFKQLSRSKEEFWYLEKLHYHILRVAHIPVRNIGTLAGNLVLKNNHPDFQSDIFLLFDCVGAVVTLVNRQQEQIDLSFSEFLTVNLVGKVLTQIKFPPLTKDYKLVTYKITPKEQNAHAEVNSGFLFKFDPETRVILKASIVYVGITPTFTHAYNTEKFLIGQNMFNNEVLQGALHCLETEIHPLNSPPDPSPFFKKKLAVNLFYKCVLTLCPPEILNPFYKSGSTTPREDRPAVSHSYQEFDTDKKEYPITQPLLKKEGMIQCAGEAVYSDDVPTIKDEVFAAFVLSHIASAEIESIDGSEAMKIEEVKAVLTSADILGENNVVKLGLILLVDKEELLASSYVRYYNQPVAIVVATDQATADRASNFVKVNYKNISKKPLRLTIEDAIKAPKEENRLVFYPGITPKDRGTNVQKVIKGRFISPLQYHFMMELHSTVAIPVDEGLEMYTSTQHLDSIQAAVAQILNINESSIKVITRRCGGAFGCKISRSNFVACATALVAKKTNRPCRMAMRLPDIMRALGKRCNSRLDYEVGVNNEGAIQYMDSTFYVNDGLVSNENENTYATDSLKNCYNPDRWKVDSFGVLLDVPSNCYMRAPGGFEGISAIEHIMEHIAQEIRKDSVHVRMANYRKQDNPLPQLIPKFKKRIDYKIREKFIESFNAHNRWKKRAIKIHNMSFPTQYLGNYGALVGVYHADGSVVVSIGGVEIGQGIFTRIAQVAANEFHIPVEKVNVLPNYNFTTPNSYATGSSITTECCAYSVIRSCEEINARLAPFRAAMPNASWQEIVFEADRQGINLQANYVTSPNDPRLVNYSVFGLAATEVEIDVLTGRKWIVRADLFEDCGHTINPVLDVGQVEGAFIQALSLWLVEDFKFNKHTGEVYTDRTWNYKIIGAKDIPNDFRIYLRRHTYNPVGILGSKAVGEPPICLGYVVVDSIREAVQASRHDSGYATNKYLDIDVPVTNEIVLLASEVRTEEMLLH